VALERGALTLSVAPRSASAPVLTTPEARIYVAGTQLRVDRAENRTFVAVISGTIEVEDTATGGRARLGAGQRIRVPQPETQSSDPRGGARPAVPRSRSRSVATSRAGAASRVDADDIRRVIRSGDDARAQALIADARRRALGNGRLLAELGILEAEAHVAAGRFRVALDAYLAVSERYPSSQQGEIGLYAAAQLAAGRLGDRARAASLLRTYVERYPHGLFISEARAGVP
jgi:hypothetical protein